jgi:putative hydrolase of the HAD superfamily
MIVIEDSMHGVEAAKAAGARCIAVPHARVRAEHLGRADLIVPSLESPDLHRLLDI